MLSSLGLLPALHSAGRQQKGGVLVGKVGVAHTTSAWRVNAKAAWKCAERSLQLFSATEEAAAGNRGQGWPRPAKGFGRKCSF